MNIAFIIRQLSDYRLMGPVIDRALESRLRVECWHDYHSWTTGPKKYLFPDTAASPHFQHGQPDVQSYLGPAELVRRLTRGHVDAIVSIGTIESDTAGAVPSVRPPWVCLQSGIDTFWAHTAETLEGCDLLAVHSPWWIDWAAARYGSADRISEVPALRARLHSRSQYVGFPEGEAAGLVDPEEVRARWGIPRTQPVVVFLPFPQGVGRNTFWPKRVFAEPSRARRLLNVVTHRQFQYLRAAWHRANDPDVARAVRTFCDRNGAFLLVKSREKTPIPGYVRAVADKCIYDEIYYPPTLIEALSIANLCISYYSLSVLEAAAVGVCNLCIAYDLEDYVGRQGGGSELTDLRSFFNRTPGGVFEFGSVSKTLEAGEAIAALPRGTLDDFRVAAMDHREYRDKFLGTDDGLSAARVVAAVGSLTASTAVENGPRAR